ncbi:hypothetical protein EFA69_13290 [Rufibacter immobilis]|uniref:STAS/SEC14 domain-containing protein n=1 Tax=Rufibacter immobilis TaxID=1348778 RepID=A0A3M9MQJ1_9BACT|nr:hypothetical protein [Rufibacter immobilis]RNI27143.1 hypothetical protein EFA69_13290 [Rufibacter immobilis]
MHNRVLLSEPHVTIKYDVLTEILHVEWTGEQTEATVRDGCDKILKHVVSTRASKVFNDNSLVTGNWSDAAQWGAKVWFPAMYKAGVKYFAWLLSPEIYSQLSTKETLKHDINGIIILSFEERASAENWLLVM